ncbi:Hypothetical predicted protein [Cloeon dipterum]|uniref:C-type lectin domain-containing protein n=1 Tax=Cloeon dipterum TaxID=197152 RepID=A0A8S1D3A1_9INSE|nr:Hypothetical predicted protein [Cloeon dipterum]
MELFRATEKELRSTLEQARSYKEQTRRDVAQLKHLLNHSNGEELIALKERCARADDMNLTKLTNDKMYHFEQEKRTWHVSKAFCEEHGMHLATTKNAEEIYILHRKLRVLKIDELAWLSGTNSKQEHGHFIWHDGSVMNTNSTMWDNKNKALVEGVDRCLFVYKGFEAFLYHAKCDRESAFICERPTICEHI